MPRLQRTLLVAPILVALLACESQPAPAPPVSPRPAPAPPAPANAAPVVPSPAAPATDPDIPAELRERGATAIELWDAYRIDRSIRPAYLSADFDGDGAHDYVVSVAEAGERPRLLVLFGRGHTVAWIAEDDLPARDSWHVHTRATRVPPSFDGKPAPGLLGDAFVMAKAESSSALIYWDGERFRSHWLSD